VEEEEEGEEGEGGGVHGWRLEMGGGVKKKVGRAWGFSLCAGVGVFADAGSVRGRGETRG